MKTEARFFLAVLLMLGVLVGTNRLFPPEVPEVPADSAAVGEEPSGEVGGLPGITDVPAAEVTGADPEPVTPQEAAPANPTPVTRDVVVEGPLFRYVFTTEGARLASGQMAEFDALNRGGPVELIPDGVGAYLGQKVVVGSDTLDLTRVPFRVEPEAGLNLETGGAAESLRFLYDHPSGNFSFSVEYTFTPDDYTIGVHGEVIGVDRSLLLTDLGIGLAYAESDSSLEARSMAYVYNHQADGIRSVLLEKADPTVVNGPLLWTAFRNKFFVAALLAGEGEDVAADDLLGGLLVGPSDIQDRVTVTAAQTVAGGSYAYRLYLGPQQYALLSSLGQGMEEVNPYGWRLFRPIIRPFVSVIMTVLNFLHEQLNLSYGWVLVVFGVAMRVVLFPLNHKAMRAQLRNMAVQPLVTEIQAKYKDNPEKLNKEMMRLYKEHGFNPLAGCLPMLLPWPVLIALFFVFQNTIELRGVPFLWLPDLSAKDPLYILPIIMALSMFLIQWVSMRSIEAPNPQMKMMMYIMPPMMLVIFLNLPSGLNLYYATANVATLPQQIWIAGERKKMRGQTPPKLSED